MVTGGAGFIGSNLTDALIAKNHEVLVIDNLATGFKENLNPQAKFFNLDITDQKLADIFAIEKPEVVFHFAAQIDVRKSAENPVWDANQNILGSLNLLENCKNFGVKKFIFASTGGAIYGDTTDIPTKENHAEQPLSPYGIAKLAIEKYLYYYQEIFGLAYVILRYANVYGPRQNAKGEAGVVAIFCDKLLAGQVPVINGDGKQTRDYTYVSDVVWANLLALDKASNVIYNVGTGIETDVNQLADLIKGNFKTDLEFTHGEAKAVEQQRSCLDSGKIKKELGWQPEVKLEEGIKKTADWFKGK